MTIRPHPLVAATLRCALLLALILSLTAGCGDQERAHSPSPFLHVHGLGVNPADEKLYAATHTGVFVVENGSARLIANRRQDTMGFTVAGPDHFLGSGHPASLDEPNPLGLIKSDDAAGTWSTVAFGGEEDFHAIDSVGSRIYAYSAGQSALLHSPNDGGTWDTVARDGLLDIAVDPTDPDQVLAAQFNGSLKSYRLGSPPVDIDDAPALNTIDWNPKGDVVGTGRGGRVWVSSDSGITWKPRGDLPATAEALTVRSATWYAATATGIHASRDRGRTWTVVLENP